MKKMLVLFVCFVFVSACGGGATENTNEPSKPGKEIEGQPLDNSGKPIPGIPDPKNANLSNVAPGATPTPGIPDPGNADITNQKGATPTPGIPDEATRKRMIEEIRKNPNAVNTAPKTEPAKKTTKRGPLNRPRKTNR